MKNVRKPKDGITPVCLRLELRDEYLSDYQKRILIRNKYKPICINKDGMSVMDDVGGMAGFADFLETIYEGEDKEESANVLVLAQSLDWSTKKVPAKKML